MCSANVSKVQLINGIDRKASPYTNSNSQD